MIQNKEAIEETINKTDYIKSKSSAWQKQNQKISKKKRRKAKKQRINEEKYSQKTIRSIILFKNISGYSCSTVYNSKKLETT